jgi:hypothetical protein
MAFLLVFQQQRVDATIANATALAHVTPLAFAANRILEVAAH